MTDFNTHSLLHIWLCPSLSGCSTLKHKDSDLTVGFCVLPLKPEEHLRLRYRDKHEVL